MGKKRQRVPSTGNEFIRRAENGGCTTRNGKGSHVLVFFKGGHGTQTVPRGNKQLGPGLRKKLIKAFTAAGLLLYLGGYAWLELLSAL